MSAARAGAPARVASVDVVTGEVLVPRPGSTRHPVARVLVRMAGEPVGLVDVAWPSDDAADLVVATRAVAWAELADQLVATSHRLGRQVPQGPDELSGDPADDGGPGAGAGPAAAPGDEVFATVAIASLRAVASTVECVRHVLASTHRSFEVVVVDNDDDPGPLRDALAATFPDEPRVRHVHEPHRGLSRARNTGLAQARGSIVVFTDDDVRVDRQWLARIVAAFDAAPGVACVTGSILPAELETRAQAWLEEYGGFNKGFDRALFDLADHRRHEPLYPYDAGRFGSGANIALRADVARSLGGFAVDLGAGTPAHGGEDLDLLQRVVSTGHTLVYEPSALLWHAHRRSEEALRRQMYRYGVGLSATVTKWLLQDRRTAWDVARRLPAGAVHVLAPSSRKNAQRSTGYPAHLAARELLGLLVGPVAYLRSRRAAGRA